MNLALLAATIAAYVVNQAILKGSGALFFTGYFNDVLAGVLLVTWSNLIATPAPAVRAWLLSLRGTLVLVGGASIVWEGIAPRVLPWAHADVLDVAAYFAGAAFALLALRLGDDRGKARARLARTGDARP